MSVGGQGPSGVIAPSVVCVWVGELGRGRHRSWKVLDAGEGETDWSEQASAGTLWKEPRADKLSNAPQLQGKSPDGLSVKLSQHNAVLAICFARPPWHKMASQLCFDTLE